MKSDARRLPPCAAIKGKQGSRIDIRWYHVALFYFLTSLAFAGVSATWAGPTWLSGKVLDSGLRLPLCAAFHGERRFRVEKRRYHVDLLHFLTSPCVPWGFAIPEIIFHNLAMGLGASVPRGSGVSGPPDPP